MLYELDLFGPSESKVAYTNIQNMFESQFFNISFDKMATNYALAAGQKTAFTEILQRVKAISEIHLENTTDVLIFVLS